VLTPVLSFFYQVTQCVKTIGLHHTQAKLKLSKVLAYLYGLNFNPIIHLTALTIIRQTRSMKINTKYTEINTNESTHIASWAQCDKTQSREL